MQLIIPPMHFSFSIFVTAPKIKNLFMGLKEKSNFGELIFEGLFLEKFLAVAFEAVISHKCFLNGIVLFGDEFSY